MDAHGDNVIARCVILLYALNKDESSLADAGENPERGGAICPPTSRAAKAFIALTLAVLPTCGRSNGSRRSVHLGPSPATLGGVERGPITPQRKENPGEPPGEGDEGDRRAPSARDPLRPPA